MDILFLHNNYPGQFAHLAQAFAAHPSHRVVFLTNREDPENEPLSGVRVERFLIHRGVTDGVHPYVRSIEHAAITGQGVMRALHELLNNDFHPQLVFAHGSNGLMLFLRQLLPKAQLVGYFEWWFNDAQASWLRGDDSLDSKLLMTMRNSVTLQELELCDLAVTPTPWQREQFPRAQQSKLKVVFDGVNTRFFRPKPWRGDLSVQGEAMEQPLVLPPEARLLSYATRGMEPLRGFPQFMRMLPELMKRFPDLEVVVAGNDRIAYSYGAPSHQGSWKEHLLAELGHRLDRTRLHFTGLLNYGDYIQLLQRSDLHVYFSGPYVTSWGLFQAAACGSHLLVNRDPAISYVLKEHQAIWGDLNQPEQLLQSASDWLTGAMARRSEPRTSKLEPTWSLESCLHQWEQLITPLAEKAQNID